MIKIINFTDINEDLESKFTNFILLSFPESRLYTYESVVYYSNDSDEIIGFCGINIYDKIILISQLCVNTKNRNQGIATKLLEFVEKQFKNNNSSIILFVRKYGDNVNTKCLYDFYTKRGFSEIYSDKYKYKLSKQI